MEEMRYRFQCFDVADCDVVIYSTYRESIVEAVQSHWRDSHGEELSADDVGPMIELLPD